MSPGAGAHGDLNGMRSPVGDDRTPATAPDSTPVTTKRQRFCGAARGEELSDAATVLRPAR